MTTVISVENLSKRYQLGTIGNRTLYQDLNRWWARRRGKPDPILKIGEIDYGNREGEYIWALRDLSFQVQQGEVLGIIGRNGAGKSTLLKILSRVTAPTSGIVRVKGRIASLLEVGTGFHPELTGRENIYLNGAIMGMLRAEIDRKLDEIVGFSGVEKFIDTPVKRYSSGMYVRLAFSIAAHLDPEILIVDEVLAVGDAEFQKKCLGKMGEVAGGGRTVLFVSHNMGSVSKLCNTACVIEAGEIVAYDKVSAAIDYYLRLISTIGIENIDFLGNLLGHIQFQKIDINDMDIKSGVYVRPKDKIRIDITAKCLKEIPLFRTTLSLFRGDTRIMSTHDVGKPTNISPGLYKLHYEIPEYILRPGEYILGLGGQREGSGEYIWNPTAGRFFVSEEWDDRMDPFNFGIINLGNLGERHSIGYEE